jgi:hypothetical protein
VLRATGLGAAAQREAFQRLMLRGAEAPELIEN